MAYNPYNPIQPTAKPAQPALTQFNSAYKAPQLSMLAGVQNSDVMNPVRMYNNQYFVPENFQAGNRWSTATLDPSWATQNGGTAFTANVQGAPITGGGAGTSVTGYNVNQQKGYLFNQDPSSWLSGSQGLTFNPGKGSGALKDFVKNVAPIAGIAALPFAAAGLAGMAGYGGGISGMSGMGLGAVGAGSGAAPVFGYGGLAGQASGVGGALAPAIGGIEGAGGAGMLAGGGFGGAAADAAGGGLLSGSIPSMAGSSTMGGAGVGAAGGTGAGAAGLSAASTGVAAGGSSGLSQLFSGLGGSGGKMGFDLGAMAGGLLGGGLQYLGANKAANSNIEAARIAADASKFRPWNVYSGFGSGTMLGNTATAKLSPEYQALRDQYLNIAGNTAGALDQYNPDAMAQKMYGKLRDVSAFQRQQDANAFENRLQAQGMMGLNQNGENPLMGAYQRAQQQADLQREIGAYGMSQDWADQMLARATGASNAATGLDALPMQNLSLGGNFGGAQADAARFGANSVFQANQGKNAAYANLWGNLGNTVGQGVGQYLSGVDWSSSPFTTKKA